LVNSFADSIDEMAGSHSSVATSGESELFAQELRSLEQTLSVLEKRVSAVERVNARLEGVALTTARALEEISQHWDAVYEAMRRIEEPGVNELRRERDTSRPTKQKSS
jgi:methyl-accepting chemotaxis protein